MPHDRTDAAEYGTEPTRLECRMDGLRGGVVAVLEADSDLGSIFGRGQDHPIPLGWGVGQRLLEQHPNSGAEAIDRKIGC